jgi:predicted Zn finger-like uncharacterized protein
MDVRCEKCGTEYEFDNERVTEEGVTVKCSTCGHLFKIRKKSFVLTEPVVLGKKGADEGRNWMIRRGDGTILSFKELTTLQKWIVERKVAREDEISKSGETWKRLGSIAELASFFQVVDQASSATAPGLPAQLPIQQSPAPATGSTQPLPAAMPAASVPTPVDIPTSSAAQYTAESPAQPADQALPAEEVAPAPASAPIDVPPASPETGGEPDSWGEMPPDDDDDMIEKWKRRGRRKWYFIVPFIAIVLGLGGWYLVSKDSFMKVVGMITGQRAEIPPQAKSLLESGLAHLLKDSANELAAAKKDINAAIEKAAGNYPEAMATLAEVDVTQADENRQKIGMLDEQITQLQKKIDELKPTNGKEPDDKVAAEIAPLHNQKVDLQRERLKLTDAARKDLEEAKRLIDASVGLAEKNVVPKYALADYIRVMSRDRAGVEAALREASALTKGENPWILFIDGASLAEDPGSLMAAFEKLNRAVALEPRMVRARYLLAKVLAALKRPDEAKLQAERVLQDSPDHELAKQLLASLQPKPKPEPKSETKPAEPGQPTTYEGWKNLADALQEKGLVGKALKAYDKALELKPEDVEALNGKGLCHLDNGSYGMAITWFRRALKKNPRFADAIMGLAESYKYQGNKEQARTYYQRYLDVLPGGPEAAVARRNLKEMK